MLPWQALQELMEHEDQLMATMIEEGAPLGVLEQVHYTLFLALFGTVWPEGEAW